MTVLFNQWIPNGGALSSFAYMNLLGQGSVSPVVQRAGSLDIVTDPLGQKGSVLRHRIQQGDTRFSDNALKVMLNDVSPAASTSDPITDWAGQSGTRRWYRFCFMVTDWTEEPQHVSGNQLTVIWQIHDQKDSDPDVYVEPPLWLIDDGVGGWVFYNTYCASAVTTTSPVNYTRRILTRIPRVLNKWEDILVYMKPSWTSGEMKIWRDRRLIFQEAGVPNCINHQPGNGGSYNFTEIGVYGGKSGQVTNRTVYHCGYQKGDEAYSTFNGFMSAVGESQTELETTFTGTMCV